MVDNPSPNPSSDATPNPTPGAAPSLRIIDKPAQKDNPWGLLGGILAFIIGIFTGLGDLFGSVLGDAGNGISNLFSSLFGGGRDSQENPPSNPNPGQRLQNAGDAVHASSSRILNTVGGDALHLGQGSTDQKLKQMRANYSAIGINPDSIKAIMPLDTPIAYVTSQFGHREKPGPNASSDHKGVDIAPPGSASNPNPNIIAAMPGVVTDVYNDPGGYGNVIYIKGIDGLEYRYAHMKDSSAAVTVGQEVTQAQVIGVMGATGDAEGAHLHYEVRENGTPINPYILGLQRHNGDTMTHSEDVAYLKAHDPNPQAAIVAATNLNLPSLGVASSDYIPPTASQTQRGASRSNA